jgi:hypothetical protein
VSDRHEHSHPHDHTHGHRHDRRQRHGLRHRIGHLLAPHSHETADKVDSALESSARGMRALWVSP